MNDRVAVGRLVLVPALITLAVTGLRLVGELLRWDPRFFSREAGGAGAIVGIVWLVPVFGVYFARKLVSAGEGPSGAGKALGFAFLGVVVQPQLDATLWTRPADSLGAASPDVDPLPLDVQLDGPDGPRLFEPQQLAVEFDIPHGASPPDQFELEPSLHLPLPAEKPDEPKILR